jgi:hypothetical protein
LIPSGPPVEQFGGRLPAANWLFGRQAPGYRIPMGQQFSGLAVADLMGQAAEVGGPEPVRTFTSRSRSMLAAAGIVVSDEGKARARARLREADRRMTPEAWQRLKERFDPDAA